MSPLCPHNAQICRHLRGIELFSGMVKRQYCPERVAVVLAPAVRVGYHMSMEANYDHGTIPKTGWAPLVPELVVSKIDDSIEFWTVLLGFRVAYRRPEEKFVYLERPEGAQIMLCERNGKWETADLEAPYGRGAMFQIYITGVDDVLAKVTESGHEIYSGPREVWRQTGDTESGQREFFVQDPDGYLVMVAENLGARPLSVPE